jgi:hypothetical protein
MRLTVAEQDGMVQTRRAGRMGKLGLQDVSPIFHTAIGTLENARRELCNGA